MKGFSAALVEVLRKNQGRFHPVVEFDPQTESLVASDFSAANEELAHISTADTSQFTQFVFALLKTKDAKFGIGGYNELRSVYQSSSLFDKNLIPADNDLIAEPRRLHLGIDIWGQAGTEIFTPMNGTVHSFAFNDHTGDYGATIILEHKLGPITFYTLYGHLSLRDIGDLVEGTSFFAGERLARFGRPSENGNWPPHLHFQLICNLESYKGDYPGVCKFSEKNKYLQNCPDPDLILQINRFIT